MFESLKIWLHQGKQYIPDVTTTSVPGVFRGRPVITNAEVDEDALADLCPMGAIAVRPLSIDLGKCSFCGECAFACPQKISFTKDYKLASTQRENLIVRAGEDKYFVIAIGKEEITLLGELSKDQLKDIDLPNTSTTSGLDFKSILDKLSKKENN